MHSLFKVFAFMVVGILACVAAVAIAYIAKDQYDLAAKVALFGGGGTIAVAFVIVLLVLDGNSDQ